MNIGQIHVVWTGGPSSPGLTVLNVEDSGTGNYPAALAAVRTFFASQVAAIPDEMSLQVQGLVNKYSAETGQLNGEVQVGAGDIPAVLLGTFAGAYMHGAGCRVDWNTSAIRNGRRVSGRTYIVPFAPASFTTDGELSSASVTSIGNAGQTLLNSLSAASLPMVVWSRPSPTNPVGLGSPVIGLRVPSKGAMLRGRRG